MAELARSQIVVGNKGIDARFGRLRAIRRAGAAAAKLQLCWWCTRSPTGTRWAPARSRPRAGPARQVAVLFVTTVAVFMAFLDVTIVNVAFPSMAEDFPEASLSDCPGSSTPTTSSSPPRLFGQARGSRRPAAAVLRWSLAPPRGLGAVRVRARRRVPDRRAHGAAALIPTSLALRAARVPARAPWPRACGPRRAPSRRRRGRRSAASLVDAGSWRWVFFVNLVALACTAGAAC